MILRGRKIGFSMLEIALVMGLAGMIFLMAFILVPQIQRNQRDEARKDDVMAIVQNLKKFQTNNKGVLPNGTAAVTKRPNSRPSNPSTWEGFYYDYIEEGFADPDGTSYILVPVVCNSGSSGIARGDKCNYNQTISSIDVNSEVNNLNHHLFIFSHATCTEDYASYADNPRNFAIVTRLEGSGTFCFGS